MKLLTVLVGLFSICAAIPLDIPSDNRHYVAGESRYIWMSYGDEEARLVDLQEQVDEASGRRGGATNEYWLFTRDNPTTRQVLVLNDVDSVKKSNYRADRGTVVVVHGWGGDGYSEVNPTVTAAFLAVMDVNVIVLHWNEMADNNYFSASIRVPTVGRYLATFLTWLIDDVGGDWDQLHLVGYSLGAHVVGIAGRETGGKAARVTGLDPAGPLWYGITGILKRFSLTSAAGRYVEAIHTDGRAQGIMERSGHADFYPNGGRHAQPGCDFWGRGDFISITGCSHKRAHELFTSSIYTPERFVGKRCTNLRQAERNECTGEELHMGTGSFSKSGYGYFALTTGASWPF